MIYLLKNVAKTQDVPLDRVPFSPLIPAKTTGPLLRINIFLYSYPKLVETYRNQVVYSTV